MKDVYQHIITHHNSPDLVITDLTTPKGLEGALLAQDLRSAGYKGGLVALSGYDQSQINIDSLFRAGFDGMISRFGVTNLPKKVVTSIQNYFYYKDLHRWAR